MVSQVLARTEEASSGKRIKSQLLATRGVSPFLAWGDFHARSRFARSTIPEEKWGTTRSLVNRLPLCHNAFDTPAGFFCQMVSTPDVHLYHVTLSLGTIRWQIRWRRNAMAEQAWLFCRFVADTRNFLRVQVLR